MHQVSRPPTLSPDRVEEVLVRTPEIEFLGLLQQPECQQRLFEAGQGLGAFLEGSVDVVARNLVRSAFGQGGPALLLPLPVAVIRAGHHEVLARVALAIERAVVSTDDGSERAQPVLRREGSEVDQQVLRSALLTPTAGEKSTAQHLMVDLAALPTEHGPCT